MLAPANGTFSLIWLLIALPALGAAILLLGGRRTNAWGHLLGVLMPVASFVVAAFLFAAMLGQPAEERGAVQHLYDWQIVGAFKVPFSLQLDQLSMVFVLLITFVGSLIHIYAIGYMAHDPARRKFFGYLNLFVAAMLLLVLADNYLLLYVGWEGVGLASFLLIGWYQYKDSAAVAAKKAFIINRVGDFGLSLAIMFMFAVFGGVTFETVNAGIGSASEGTATWIGLLLLLAACGKSAQFPLQAWLFDAMEGPTPVSALIHAATMVTAGVYLIVRSNAIFDAAPTARLLVLIVGCISLIWGAIIGCAKDDLKKALAGSTMSQIGYMVVAAGLGPVGYVFAIFHLLTHGFFKAGLFLGAGSVMHANNDKINMRHLGALRTVMMITFVTFGICTLAIMGIPPFAGFFSKDDIIKAAFSQSPVAGVVTLIGAGITGFYMTRIFLMTFLGKARWEDDQHPHESPAVMWIPMVVLAIGATIGGVLMWPSHWLETWLEPAVPYQEHAQTLPEWLWIIITVGTALIGILWAVALYRREVPVTPPAGSLLTRAAREELYGNEINETLTMLPGQVLTRSSVFFDNRVVDGFVNGMAAVVWGVSGALRTVQNGFARSYALTMLGGAVLLVALLVLVRL
ncbi:MAG: NADH-quinone oxidoreductase subunit L [Actinobacteria bacterium]|nr:NADH-quinone oxidoreductase subunit L [Actinomycetota bacterium]